jgi:tRNA A-37 threonylcarbamoyl transferase component Bud32
LSAHGDTAFKYLHFPIYSATGEELKQENQADNSQLTGQILDFCKHIAGQAKIAAVALVDNYAAKPADERAIHAVMLVIHDFQPRLMSYLKTVKNKTVFVFAVDQWFFERDVDRGLLGEAIAGKLIFPYTALQGDAYLREEEIALKKRLVSELLENLVINFPELASSIQIMPQYFMYEVFSNRVRVFPLLAYDLLELNGCLLQREEEDLVSYKIALQRLEAEEKIRTQDGYVFITKKFIAQCQDPKLRFINLSKNAPRTLFTSLFGVAPQLMNILSKNAEAFFRTQKINWVTFPNHSINFIDPQKYVFFPTSEGLVSLSNKIDIKGFTQRMLLKGENADVEVEPIGGVLNDVYLINTYGINGDRKVLVKRFKDWSGFKWFPLTLWSFGARSFVVSGQARLAKEIATGEFLRNQGFKVPKILHVSNAERIVFMEFIEGEGLNQAIKRYSTTSDEKVTLAVLEAVEEFGSILAKVHGHNVCLGDTKPDNVLIKPDGALYLIDFEQALQGGDKAWDIAVFLYYCGHYLQPFDSNLKAESIAVAFIEGYLHGGGSLEDIHKAALSKYTRVFSIFTMPATMLAFSNVCRRAESPR